jgi:Pyruvate/2-oxoacid:ferredoxin oxidoreductase gamma subunit
MSNHQINILLAGVGGQGILTLSRIISQAALQAGYIVTSAETHGMSQRDGSVTVHLRIGTHEVHPLVNKADFLIALEPHEVLRNSIHLSEHTSVISEKKSLIPPSVHQNKQIEITASCDGCSICVSDSGCPINQYLRYPTGIWIRSPAAELVNGRLSVKDACTKCGHCQEICPNNAIVIDTSNYLTDIEPALETISKKLYIIAAAELAQEIGNPRAANIVMFGAFQKLQDRIKLPKKTCREVITSLFPRSVESNLKAFQLGQDRV